MKISNSSCLRAVEGGLSPILATVSGPVTQTFPSKLPSHASSFQIPEDGPRKALVAASRAVAAGGEERAVRGPAGGSLVRAARPQVVPHGPGPGLPAGAGGVPGGVGAGGEGPGPAEQDQPGLTPPF